MNNRLAKKTVACLVGVSFAAAVCVPSAAIASEGRLYASEASEMGPTAEDHQKIAGPVASVNGTEYSTLQEAVEAATSGDTVKLLDDIDWVEPEGTVLNIAGLIIDLDGHCISAENFHLIFDGGNFVIQDGSFDSKGGSYGLFIGDESTANGAVVRNVNIYGGVNVYNSSNVVLENVHVLASGPAAYYALWCDQGGDVIVRGGLYEKPDQGKANALIGISKEGGSATIESGVFKIAQSGVLALKGDYSAPTIKGGSFSVNPAEYVAMGYEAAESNGSWTVQLKEELRVAEIEGAYYPTVAEAVAAARNGQTVKLLKGAEEDAEIRIDGNRSITLDLAGYKLDTRAHQIVVESGSGLTVKGDGELTNASTNNAVGSYVAYGMSGSNVTFDGVTVKGAYGLYAMGSASVKRASFDVTGGCAIAINGSAKVEIGDSVATAEENARNVIVNSANNCISTQAKEGSADALCTVYGGTFTAGTNPDNPGNPWNSGPVYWASRGTLDIRGGVFKADVATAAVFQKNGTVKVSDGEFSSKDGFKIDATAKDTTEIATEISGGKFTGTRSGFYSNASNGYIDYGTSYSVKVTGGEFRGGSEGAIYVKEGAAIVAAGKRALEVTGGSFSEDPTEFVPASGYEVLESNGMFSVSKYVPPTPPSGGGSTSDKTEVEHNQDGSTTTTVTKPDGSQTITHETATGTESVVKKDKDGNVTSTEVSVSNQDAESGKVELPIDKSEPAADADKAQAVEVKVPSTVTPDKPVQVTVPVAKAEGAEPDYGIVVYAIDEDGNETLIPKTAVDDDGNVVFEATGNVTIKVVDNAKDMPDVTDADWFAGDVVDFATARGIVNGVDMPDGTKEFQGYGKTTRGMFVAMLHNLELNPEAASDASLPDVPANAFYADAAAWALEEGVLSGVDMPDGTKQFQGGADVTREQVAVFLMRYAESLGMDTSRRAEIDFPDASEVSAFAKDAMSWAVAEDLFKGDDATGELNPTDGAARAEVAAVIMRFINLMYA